MASKVMSVAHGINCDCKRCERCKVNAITNNDNLCESCREYINDLPKNHCHTCGKCNCCSCDCY